MIDIIIDCGGTSSQCVTVRGNEIVERLTLSGYNAFTHDMSHLAEILYKCSKDFSQVEQVNVYASGMTETQVRRHEDYFSGLRSFQNSKLSFHSDLMLCAHAGFEKSPVVVGILGTGSNVASYDGEQMTKENPSLGYVVADYGGGVDIGKRLFYHMMREKSKAWHQLKMVMPDLGSSLTSIYSSHQSAKSFFSILTTFVSKMDTIPEELDQVIVSSFEDFVRFDLMPELNYQAEAGNEPLIYLFGSISHHFNKELTRAVRKFTSLELKTAQYPLEVYLSKIENS